jgi:hypothetical protein
MISFAKIPCCIRYWRGMCGIFLLETETVVMVKFGSKIYFGISMECDGYC